MRPHFDNISYFLTYFDGNGGKPNYSCPVPGPLTQRNNLTKSLITLAFSFFGALISFAQTNADSLWNVWQSPEIHDSSRCEALEKLIWKNFLFTNPDSAASLSRDLYDFAVQRSQNKFISSSKNTEGIAFTVRGMYDEALLSYNESLRIADSIADKKLYELTLNNVGILHGQRGNFVEALKCYLEVMEIKKDLGETEVQMRAQISNIGRIYATLGDWPMAIQYRKRSLILAEDAGDLKLQANSNHNLGSIYERQGKDSLAFSHLHKSIELYTQAGDLGGIGYAMNTLGRTFRNIDQIDSAKACFQKAVEIHTTYDNLYALTFPLVNLGLIYLNRELYEEAEEHCQRSYDLAKNSDILETQFLACECLYAVKKQIGNENEALEFHEQMRVLEDSLNAQEAMKELQFMEFRKLQEADSLKVSEEKQRLNEAHQVEVEGKEQSRNIFVILGSLTLLIAIILFGRYRRVRSAKAKVQEEKDQSESLLLNILPEEIARELKETGKAKARNFHEVTVLFTDFKGFTQASEKLGPEALVEEINVCFKEFDEIVGRHGIEKIKTIGDAYMAAGGLPVADDNSVENVIRAALEMQDFMKTRKAEKDAAGEPGFDMRVGVHTGPVVAGIVGVKKFQYDVWGDTVNTASRMESSGAVKKVNISATTFNEMKDHPEFSFESRGLVEAKGKGELEMYFVERNHT